MFKVHNLNFGIRCEICSNLIIKSPERRQWRLSGVFIVDFEYIYHLVLVFLLLTSGKCRLRQVYVITCSVTLCSLLNSPICSQYVYKILERLCKFVNYTKNERGNGKCSKKFLVLKSPLVSPNSELCNKCSTMNTQNKNLKLIYNEIYNRFFHRP